MSGNIGTLEIIGIIGIVWKFLAFSPLMRPSVTDTCGGGVGANSLSL